MYYENILYFILNIATHQSDVVSNYYVISFCVGVLLDKQHADLI